MRDVLRLEHQFAGGRGVLRPYFDIADALAALAPLYPQLLECAHPALVAGSPRFHALADPDLLLGQLLVEQGRMLGFILQRGTLQQDVVVVAARPDPQLSAIKL